MNEIQNLFGTAQPTNQSAATIVRKILIRQCGDRDYSAQECIWIVLGFSFYSSSRSFVILNLSHDAYLPIDINSREAEDHTARDSEKTYADRLVDFGIARRRGHPGLNADQEHENRTRTERQEAEQMSMFNFFGVYYKRSRNDVWSKYVKRPIVRAFPCLSLRSDVSAEKNERFFELQLKLHVPWHTNFEQHLNPDRRPWAEIYRIHSHQILNLINLDEIEIEDSDDEFENEDPHNFDDIDLHEWMIYARMLPENVLSQAELGLREQDNIDWTATFANYDIQQLRTFTRNLQEEHRSTNDDFAMPDVTFSEEQRKVLDVVSAQIHFLRTGVRTEQFRQSVVIQGKAGSGKSTLIKAIKAVLNQELGPDSFVVMAPTGAAAANIKATTLHSTLKINVNRQLQNLSPASLQPMQEDLHNCRFVIIDEISLLGCTLFKKVDLRCREAKGVHDLPFGGMFFFSSRRFETTVTEIINYYRPILKLYFTNFSTEKRHAKCGNIGIRKDLEI